jgi:predicted MFS family arabinose efflux permease
LAKSGYGEFRRGWPIVLSSMLGIGLGLSPLPFYTTGVFAPHLAKAFGWKIGDIMGGITMTTLMVLWAGPVAGILATRFGVRRVAITSLVLFSLSFMSFALLTQSLTQYYLTWAIAAALGAGTLPITWTRAVNHWFDARKGLALGISLMGTGLFGFFSKNLTTALIAALGWRGAYIGLGLLPLVVATPLALIMFRDRDPKRVDDGAPAEGLTFLETLKEWRFWVIAAALLPISFALAGPIPNMENILKTGGMGPDTVLKLTPLIGLSALSGRVLGGWLLDRFWAPGIAFLILCSPGISCFVLAHAPLAFNGALISILLIGFAVGVEYDLMGYFVARYFGMRGYTVTYGVLYVFFSLGAGAGPLLFGRSFDAHGSYASILTLSSGLLIAGALALLTLGRYRKFDAIADSADTSFAAV